MNPVKTPTQLRLTLDLLERADALIAAMAADLEGQYQPPADASPPPTITPYAVTPRAREWAFSQVYTGQNGSGRPVHNGCNQPQERP